MLAVSERVSGHGERDEDEEVVWHLLAGGHECAGDCDFHPIACTNTEGIAAPAPQCDVPVKLATPGERWCVSCLEIVEAGDN